MDRRALLCMIVAILLLIPILLSARRLSSLMQDDALLERAEQRLTDGSIGRALTALRELEKRDTLTKNQAERCKKLTIHVVSLALQRHHPIQRVGKRSFDPSAEGELLFGVSPIRVSARIRPADLVGPLRALTFGDEEVRLENDTVSTLISLPESGEAMTLPITAVIELPDGTTVDHVLDGTMRLRLDRGCPVINVTVGENEPVSPSADGSTRILVPPGAPVTIEVTDERGLSRVSWVAGDDEDAVSGLEKSSVRVALPANLIGSEGPLQIEVTARNQLDTTTTTSFTLDVKDERWFPVSEVLLSDTVLATHGVAVAGLEHELRVALHPGIPAHVVGMGVRTDGAAAVPLRVEGRHLVASVKLKHSGKTGISLLRGSAVLRTWVVHADTAAPSITVSCAGKPLLEDTVTVLEQGSVIEVVLEDENGLGPVRIIPTGLSPAGAQKGPRSESRRLRVPENAKGGVVVQAEDALGNATPERSFPIRARQPIRLRTIKVNGVDVGLDAIAVTHGKVAFALTHDGEGAILWTLLEPRGGTVFKHGTHELGDSGSSALSVVLDVADQAMADREIRFTDSRDSRHLATARLRVDHVPPTIRIGAWDPAEDGPRDTFEASPGTRLEITVEEAGGDADITVTGTVVLARKKNGDVVTLVVGVPEVLPAAMMIRARDAAGNVTGLAFKVVTPAVVPAVVIDLLHNGEVVGHDGPIQLKRPSELVVKVTNGMVVRATLGDGDLPLGEGGALGDPATPPGKGPLVLVVRDVAGKERAIRFLAELTPYSIPQVLKDRLQKVRESVAGRGGEAARKELAAIESAVRKASAKHLLEGERSAFLNEIRRVREEGGEERLDHPRGPTVRQAPPEGREENPPVAASHTIGLGQPGQGNGKNCSNLNCCRAIGSGHLPRFGYGGLDGPRSSSVRSRGDSGSSGTTGNAWKLVRSEPFGVRGESSPSKDGCHLVAPLFARGTGWGLTRVHPIRIKQR